MGERPIIFSGEMVRALLARRKTQTRRIVKVPGVMGGRYPIFPPEDVIELADGEFTNGVFHYRSTGALSGPYQLPATIGDHLWVREACQAEELSRPQQSRPATRLEQQRLGRTTVIECDELDGADGVRYLADSAWVKIANTSEAGDAWSSMFHYRSRGKGCCGNPVPPIHMPRWASRLTLVVTDVRVERLQDISGEDAIAEGAEWINPPCSSVGMTSKDIHCLGCQIGFMNLWEDLHGAESWSANPWVAVIGFRVHHGNIDAIPAHLAAPSPNVKTTGERASG